MIIHWIPCYDHRSLKVEQPGQNKIIVTWNGRTVAVDFSDETIVKYELEQPVTNYIHKAWRENGVLHLQIPSFGNLKEPTTIDHGEAKELSWTGSNQSAERKQI